MMFFLDCLVFTLGGWGNLFSDGNEMAHSFVGCEDGSWLLAVHLFGYCFSLALMFDIDMNESGVPFTRSCVYGYVKV